MGMVGFGRFPSTVFGQLSSRAVLAHVTTLKASPGRERLMLVSRLALLKGVEEMRTEASMPLRMVSWKKRRSVAAVVARFSSSDHLALMMCQVPTRVSDFYRMDYLTDQNPWRDSLSPRLPFPRFTLRPLFDKGFGLSR
ncbi:hypothetical protein Q3G72_031309 [Acer saccharum]|nr:hypothetical protein Q3G72_031309 [Acer saccharum]